MKHNMNRVLSIVALLMIAISTWAGEVIIKSPTGGNVTKSVSGQTCTLTVTPADGNYLKSIKAVTLVSGSAIQAPVRRADGINIDETEVTLAKTAGDDLSQEATYTFTMPSDGNLNVEVTAEFAARTSIENATTTITLATASFTYDGTAKQPAVSSVAVGGTTLAVADYTVDYEGNVNAGSNATVVVTAKNAYTGTATTTFTISPKLITSDMITLSSESLEYSGEKQIPNVTVKDKINNEDYQLDGDDYYLSYQLVNEGENPVNIQESDVVDIATYNVVVAGKGNYTGSATKSFAITKIQLEDLSVSLEGWTYGEQPEEIEPEIEGYEGEGDINFYFKAQNADDNTYTTAVPEDAGTYTIKVVVEDEHASGSATADFTIAKASLTNLAVSLEGWTYGETANTPVVTGNTGEGTVTVTYKGANDATFSETMPTYAGTHTIKATVGETTNYKSGEDTSTFTIAKADMSMVSVSYEDLVYNGEAQQLFTVNNVPENATVKYICQETDDPNEMICDPNENQYSTTVPSATEVGYYAIFYKIEGTNNYNGTQASKTYCVQIVPAEITSMTLDKESLSYTGTAQTVTITSVKAGTDDSLDVPSTGYTVTLDGVTVTGDITAKDVKEYTVAVTGKGNFTGTVSATFTIVNRTLAAEDVTFNNHWSTFYSADGAYELPEGIGAYVATGTGENSVTVTQISNIPEKVAVLLNDETTTTSTAVFGTDVKGNMLVHATNAKEVTAAEGDFYGLFNGRMKRVMGTIPAGKNYLLIPAAVNVNAGASQLTIVIDGETTDVNDVRSKMEDVRGDLYDLQGRKVQKPSKKGLYIQKGRKVVNK